MSTYSEKKMDYTTISKELTYEDTESKSVDGLQLFQMLQKYADDSMAKTEITQLLESDSDFMLDFKSKLEEMSIEKEK